MIFDHIGLFVRDIETGRSRLGAMIPIQSWSAITEDPVLKVRVQFGVDPSGLRYELVAPFGDPNPVSAALASGNNVLNHIAYRVPDLDAAAAALRAQGAMPLGPAQPALAFAGARVMFFLTSLRFILELVEQIV